MNAFPIPRAARALALFGAIASLVWAVEVGIVLSRPARALPDVVAAALLVDLGVLVPAAWYWILVRRRGWPKATLLPVALGSLIGAGALLRAAGSGVAELVPVAAGLVEACAIACAIVAARRVALAARTAGESGLDLVERLEAGFAAVLGSGAASRIFATEVALAGHALGFGRPRRGSDDASFSVHRENAYPAVLAALLLVAIMEGTAVHVLLRSVWPAAVVPHLLLSAYGLLWILGDLGSVTGRSHRVDRDALRLRIGLRFALDAPWDAVAAVTPFDPLRDRDLPGARRAVALGAPSVVVRLRHPLRARTIYGIPREVTTVLLGVDEPARFVRACGVRIEEARG